MQNPASSLFTHKINLSSQYFYSNCQFNIILGQIKKNCVSGNPTDPVPRPPTQTFLLALQPILLKHEPGKGEYQQPPITSAPDPPLILRKEK